MCCVLRVLDLMFPLESFPIGHIMDLSNKRLLPFTLVQDFRNTHLRTVFCEAVCQELRASVVRQDQTALHFSVFSFIVKMAQELADNADLKSVSVGP